MLSLIGSMLERFRNIRQTQKMTEYLDEVQEEIVKSGLPPLKAKILDWRLAKYEPAGKPILFTRIRGSPKSLEQDSAFLTAYGQVRTSIEQFSLDDDMKTALATVVVERVVPEDTVEHIVEAMPQERREKVKKIRRQILAETKNLPISTVLKFVHRADPALSIAEGNRAFLRAIEDFNRIASRAVEKEEFLDVLRSWGRIDILSVKGMYSRLMALVLRYPSKTAMEYHRMRLDISPVERAPAATREELTSLVELGYVKFDWRKRYSPNYSFIQRRHGLKPPKNVTLHEWLAFSKH